MLSVVDNKKFLKQLRTEQSISHITQTMDWAKILLTIVLVELVTESGSQTRRGAQDQSNRWGAELFSGGVAGIIIILVVCVVGIYLCLAFTCCYEDLCMKTDIRGLALKEKQGRSKNTEERTEV